MDVIRMRTGDLIPYKRNAKKHPESQIRKIAASIEQFGFRQPIVVDKNNVVIIGHGRLMAAKSLGMLEVPVVKADDLTNEQVAALRLADNRVAESPWDEELVFDELQDITIDMSQFGFNADDFAPPEPSEEADEEEDLPNSITKNVFENQETRRFPYTNYYGIPDMKPTRTVGDKMIRFRDWNTVDNCKDYIAHFFFDDYNFMAAWREPDKYIDRLREFKAVVSPDFSLYTDFPRALQILACYRRQWCGAYWQEKGIDVIPDVRWGDEESFNYCFLGIPNGGTTGVVAKRTDRDFIGIELDEEYFRIAQERIQEA